MKKVTSSLFLFVSFLACQPAGNLKPTDYVQFLEEEENGFTSKQIFGDKEYTIQLATPEYLLCKELDGNISDTIYVKRMKELKGFIFFIIKMGTTEKSRMQKGGNRISEQQLKVNEMVSYYDQQAILDIALDIDGKETLPSTYVFENNYDLSPYNTIVVGFEIGEHYESLKLNFNDRYANIHAVRASFTKEQMTRIHKLKI